MKPISKVHLSVMEFMLALAAVLVSGLVATTSARAQTFGLLHSFNSSHGADPNGALVQATNGDLYGTTVVGGTNNDGSVFKITPSGTLTMLHSFDATTDGEQPIGALIQGSNGNFYGTNSEGPIGGGSVFKITPGGTLTTLYSFCSLPDCADGDSPLGGLVEGTDGNLYGTTVFGGANDSGTVFRVTTSGTFTMLYSFCSQLNLKGYCADGGNIYAGLVQGTDGNFYGTTNVGGANGYGTVFRITPGGTLTTLYSFCAQTNCADGASPQTGLIQGTDGNFYGTTVEGNNGGTIFKITVGGTLTTLNQFCDSDIVPSCPASPSGLIQGTDGNLYGTTRFGGSNAQGTVFQMTPDGTLTTLHSFCATSGCKDGEEPLAGLVQDTNGSFYGTTYFGGTHVGAPCTNGCGTVFSVSMGLGPFVALQTSAGPVGAAVKVLGTDLTGTTGVTFNGTAATFTVVSASEITTKVPAGATTGTLQVVTPGGTLSSNVAYTVESKPLTYIPRIRGDISA